VHSREGGREKEGGREGGREKEGGREGRREVAYHAVCYISDSFSLHLS